MGCADEGGGARRHHAARCLQLPRPETRYGPFGTLVPNAAVAARMTEGLAALIRGTKAAAPRTLIMMYSSAATAVTDWRGKGIDLETIAREGKVDIFVDETWAGAWGEAGVRQGTFWNAPILGWTYQLGYMLQHAAVLADKVDGCEVAVPTKGKSIRALGMRWMALDVIQALQAPETAPAAAKVADRVMLLVDELVGRLARQERANDVMREHLIILSTRRS